MVFHSKKKFIMLKGIGQIKKLLNVGVSFIVSINNTSMKIVGLDE